MTLTIGSVATGYGGLDSAVAAFFGAEVAWVADNDPDVCKLLEARFPGIPNLGDVLAVNWETVPRVDIVTAGFPCQDVSAAGLRAGMQPGNRTGLWFAIVQAIAILRPSVVILENVRGLLSARAHSDVEQCEICVGNSPARRLRALGAVLGNLSDLGFDSEWEVVSAADAGSCHQRDRVFILAWQAAAEPGGDRFAGSAEFDGRALAGIEGAQRGHPDGCDDEAAADAGRDARAEAFQDRAALAGGS
jgi:DNA (cytosine-5)-methyltransferase 1